jgi:8-oxo-dGTP diphosphatase
MIDVVCAVIINDDSEVMLARRSDKRDIGKWEFPGGKVLPGEDLLRATAREIKEELGIDIQAITKIKTIIYDIYNLHFIKSKHLDKTQRIELKEHDQIKFFRTDDVPLDKLTAGDREFLVNTLLNSSYVPEIR